MAQLDQLNAMERHQDWITWTTNTVYTATNAALIAGIVALSVQRFVYTSYASIGLVLLIFGGFGAFVSTHWFRIILRAHTYEITWLLRSKALQDEVEVPLKYRIWQPSRPDGHQSWKSVSNLCVAFFFAWIVTSTYGAAFLIFGSLGYLANWGEVLISSIVAVAFAVAVLALGLRVLFKSFFDAEEKFNSDMKDLENQLGSTHETDGILESDKEPVSKASESLPESKKI